MRTLKPKHHLIYGVIFIADLLIMALQLHQWEYLVKPAILLSIIVIFIQLVPSGSSIFRFGLLAFFFSLLGDVVLLFSSINEVFFLAGIASFLLSHLFFILTFNRHKHSGPSYLKSKPIVIIIVAIMGITLYSLLFQHLDNILKIAVFIYASAISTMLLMAINRKNQVTESSFNWILIGAILFFISDGLLAVNKFWIAIPASSIFIMSTYMLAQYFILSGLVRQEK